MEKTKFEEPWTVNGKKGVSNTMYHANGLFDDCYIMVNQSKRR